MGAGNSPNLIGNEAPCFKWGRSHDVGVEKKTLPEYIFFASRFVDDLGKGLFERLPGRQESQKSGLVHRLDDQPVAILADRGAITGELELDRYAHRLISITSEEPNFATVLLAHDIPPLTYATV